MTRGIGPDRVIDAVGVDANAAPGDEEDLEEALQQIEPTQTTDSGTWRPGTGPTQALQWAIELVTKAGTVTLIGVYPPSVDQFPIAKALFKNLTVTMGNCNHRAYIPHLIELVRAGHVDPTG